MHQHPYELSPYQARIEATLTHMAQVHPQGAWLVIHSEQGGNPDSNFRYLTGKTLKNAVILLKTNAQGQCQSFLFYQPVDEKTELWEGSDCELDELFELGFDEVMSRHHLDNLLRDFVKEIGKECVLYCEHPGHHQWLLDNGRGRFHSKAPVSSLMGPLRVVKDPLELVLLSRAASIAHQAHERARAFIAPGLFEYEIQAELEYWFRKSEGCEPAYDSIVAAGQSGLTLHYRKNNQKLQAGELLLIDAGCRLQGYCSDVTRTWAIDGELSKSQQIALEWVRLAQEKAIAQCRPGVLLSQVHQTACEVLTQGLLEMGLLKGDLKTLVSEQRYRQFYPHGTSHWLGLDVHDCGPYGPEVVLQENMVLTVEPGLYIAPQASVPEHFHGIAIRWEDDVVVRPTPWVLGRPTP